MTLNRNQVLNLKRTMDIEYLKHFNLDVQTSAYEIYHELHSLKELKKIELPETLLKKISEILNTFNDEIENNISLKTKIQNLTELLHKEVQQKTFLETKYNRERDNNDVISNQADADQKKFKEQEAQYNTEIIKLKQHSLKHKVENDDMKTEKEKLAAENESLKKKIKQLEERIKKNEDQKEINTKPSEKQKQVITPEEANNSSVADTNKKPAESIRAKTKFSDTIDTVLINPEDKKSEEPNTSTQIQQTTPAPPSSTPTENANGKKNSNDSNSNEVDSNNINRNNLFVIGDSHCRNLNSELKKYAPPGSRVNCLTMPGKKLNQIVHSIKPQKLSPNTNVCILAGTNDVFQTTYEDMKRSYDQLYEKCKNHKIYVILIPPRYDHKNINSHILNLNCKIKYYLKRYDNVTCIDPKNVLNFYNYIQDKVHLDGKGQNSICKYIIGTIYNKLHFNPTGTQSRHTRNTYTNPRSWNARLLNTESSYDLALTQSKHTIISKPNIQCHTNFPTLGQNRITRTPSTHNYKQNTHTPIYDALKYQRQIPQNAAQITHRNTPQIMNPQHNQPRTQNYRISPPPYQDYITNITTKQNSTARNFRYVMTTLV